MKKPLMRLEGIIGSSYLGYVELYEDKVVLDHTRSELYRTNNEYYLMPKIKEIPLSDLVGVNYYPAGRSDGFIHFICKNNYEEQRIQEIKKCIAYYENHGLILQFDGIPPENKMMLIGSMDRQAYEIKLKIEELKRKSQDSLQPQTECKNGDKHRLSLFD